MTQTNTQTIGTTTPPFRLHPVRELPTGEAVGLILEHRESFADRVRFGPAANQTPAPVSAAATWLSSRIEHAAHSEALSPQQLRPVFVPAPDAALFDSTVPLACATAMAGSPLLPQEICLEFRDSALVTAGSEVETRMRAFRRRGFRVSVDIRSSQSAEMSVALRLMIDTIRVRTEDMHDPDIAERVHEARRSGICILAEAPRWRDVDELASLGIQFGVSLRADA